MLENLLVGLLANALVVIADRKDQASARQAEALRQALENPKSRIRMALVSAVRQARLPKELDDQLRHIVADDVEFHEITKALLSLTPRTSALTTALCSAIKTALKGRLTRENDLETIVREVVQSLGNAILQTPDLAPFWINARLDLLEDAVLAQARQGEASIRNLEASVKEALKFLQQVHPPHPVMKQKVSLVALPSTSPIFVGRDTFLDRLSRAWMSPQTKIVSLVGWGGVGKTAIVNSWLRTIADSGFLGANRVLAWSFFSQGARPDSVTSSEPFFANAANFFDLGLPTASPPWQIIEHLQAAMTDYRTLLVLDGLEPLQHASLPTRGSFRDTALRQFLRHLAWHFEGLCVVTSRLPLFDLHDAIPTRAYIECSVDELSVPESHRLLESYGVTATASRVKNIVEMYHGHALSLVLLAEFINRFGGTIVDDVSAWDLLRPVSRNVDRPHQMCRAYDRTFEQEGLHRERQLLRVAGLFDRPASPELIRALCSDSGVANISDLLASASDDELLASVQLLADSSLLTSSWQSPWETSIDAHPLIRDYFAEVTKNDALSAWNEAHTRVYQYLKDSVPERPNTPDEVEVLYRAASHGCQAGHHQDVLDTVFYPRIRRGNESYSTRHLGLFGTDLAALAHFLGDSWDNPVQGLRDSEPPYLLNEAGIALQAIGHLRRALRPLRKSLDLVESSKKWKLAAIRLGNLTELYLSLGELDTAASQANKGLTYARRIDDVRQMITKLCRLAHVRHVQGEIAEAEVLFEEAEAIELEKGARRNLWGREAALFAELLLDRGRNDEVIRRMQDALSFTGATANQLALAHCFLCLGKASLARGHTRRSQAFLQAATLQFRKTGYQQFAPLSSIAKAEWLLTMAERLSDRNQSDAALQQLNEGITTCSETRSLCERCELRLHRIDVDLIMMRLQLNLEMDASSIVSATTTLLKEVHDLGYLRRKPEAMLVNAEARVRAGELLPKRVIGNVAFAVRKSGISKLAKRLRDLQADLAK